MGQIQGFGINIKTDQIEKTRLCRLFVVQSDELK